MPLQMLAQPYYFFHQRNGTIYQIDLSSNVAVVFLSEFLGIRDLSWDPDQRFLFVDSESGMEIVEISNPSNRHMLIPNLGEYGGTDGALTAGNRLYVTWLKEQDNQILSTTDIFSLDDFSNVGTIPVGIAYDAILDEPAEIVYQYAVNENGDPYIEIMSTQTNTIIGTIPFATVGPQTDKKTILGGHKGKALFSYKMTPGFLHQNYATVDLRTNASSRPIPFPWRSTAHLTYDASAIIVEEVLFEKSPAEPWQYKPGNVTVFDAETGNIVQKLNLPPEGRIILFKNYPHRIFYLTSGEAPKSIIIDLETSTPSVELLDTLISIKHRAFGKNWIGDHTFINELDNGLDNARKHLARGDTANCAKELESFQNKVKREYDKKATPGGRRFVTEDGYKLLWFNALYIVDRLRR